MIYPSLIIFFIAWIMFLLGTWFEQTFKRDNRKLLPWDAIGIFAKGWRQGQRVTACSYKALYDGCVCRDKKTGRLYSRGRI